MRRSVQGAILFVVALTAPCRAAPPTDADAIVQRALRALGSPERLAGLHAATWTGDGTVHGLGDPIHYAGEWAVEGPERARIAVQGDFRGRHFERLLVIDGDRGWTRENGIVDEMDPARLAEEKERLYAAWVGTIIPLADGGFELKALPPRADRGHQLTGVRVRQAGHRDVDLYFRPDGLLGLSVATRENPRTGARTVEEIRYEIYRRFNGLPRPTRLTVRVDGRREVEGTMATFEAQRRLDPALFGRPDSGRTEPRVPAGKSPGEP